MSIVWEIQRGFYESKGIEAWAPDGVPHYITTNPSIGRSYARTVFGFLRDVWAERSRSRRVAPDPIIVEIGAGSGQFGFHFLRHLDAMHQASRFADRNYTYVMTDFAEANIAFWRSQPALAPFVDRGLLDFATFDAAAPGDVRLERAGTALGDESGRPVVLIANYVFDSLPQDLLRTGPTGLAEDRVGVTSSQPEPDLTDPHVFDRVELEWTTTPFDHQRHADDADVEPIVAWYAEHLLDASFLVPTAALRCLEHLRSAAGGPFLALIGDRGHDRLGDLLDDQGPQVGLHGGCFSLPVNFHALGMWAEAHGGTALNASGGHHALNVTGLLCGLETTGATETIAAFGAAIEDAGPDDFYTLQRVVLGADDLDLDALVSVLRWSGYDPVVLAATLPQLILQVEAAPEGAFSDVRAALLRVWDAHYPLPGALDTAFSIATVLYGMGFFIDALDFLERSLELDGPHEATYFNIGMSHYHLHRLEPALAMVRAAIALAPDFTQARNMEALIADELAT